MPQARIAVTAPTGKIGSAFLTELAGRGTAVRALGRDGSQLTAYDYKRFDFADPSTYGPALDEIDTLFIVSPASPQLGELEASVIKAAERAGVGHVILLSAALVRNSNIIAAEIHRAGERALKDSALSWTILAPTFFMQNALGVAEAVAGGAFPQAFGDARVGQIDTRDIAACAVEIATRSTQHFGKEYTLTSIAAYTGSEMASALSTVLEHPVHYVPLSEEAFREALVSRGVPAWGVDNVAQLYAHAAAGNENLVTDDARTILGRAPRDFITFVRENAAAFQPTGAI